MFLAQLMDPFRLALVIGLVVTMARTRGVTGTLLPLAAGIAFIAIIIPTTMGRAAGGLAAQIGIGLLSTALMTLLALAVWRLVSRFTG